MIEYR